MAPGSTAPRPEPQRSPTPAGLIAPVDRALRALPALRDDGSVALTSISRSSLAESERGVSAVASAVPPRDPQERLSVSLSVPATRSHAARVRELADATRATADAPSARLPAVPGPG